jgi:hypothetical protein
MPATKVSVTLLLSVFSMLAGAYPGRCDDQWSFRPMYGQKHMASIMVPDTCEYTATETGGYCLLLSSLHHAFSFSVDDNVLSKTLLQKEVFPGRSMADIETALTDHSRRGAKLWEQVIQQIFREHLDRDEKPTRQSFSAVPKDRLALGAFACRGYRYEARVDAPEAGAPGHMRAGGMLCAMTDRDELHMAIYESARSGGERAGRSTISGVWSTRRSPRPRCIPSDDGEQYLPAPRGTVTLSDAVYGGAGGVARQRMRYVLTCV